MLNFKKWIEFFEASLTNELSIEDAVNAFVQPRPEYELTASTLIDANLCPSNKSFIYLSSKDKIYVGQNGEYHREIIAREKTIDPILASELQRSYETSYGGESYTAPENAVGRIGYGVNYDRLKKILPLANIKGFLSNEKEISDGEAAMHIFMPTSFPIKKLFSEIDVIAIYSGVKTPISVAARAVQLLMENSSYSPRNIDNTIVMYDNKAHFGKEFITHASSTSSEEEQLDKKEEPKITTQQSKERSRRFIPKPQTIRQAAYQAGIPMGDWTNYPYIFRGNNYNG
jgi:hypothetical protein